MAEVREELIVVDRFSDALTKFTSFIDRMTGDLALSNSELYRLYMGLDSVADSAQNLAEELSKVAEPAKDVDDTADAADNLGKSIDEAGRKANNAASGGIDKLIKKVTKLGLAFLGIKGLRGLFDSAAATDAFEVRFQVRLQDDAFGSALYQFSQDFANSVGRGTDEILKATNNFLAITSSPDNLQRLLGISDKFALISNNDDYTALANAITQAFRTGQTRSLSNQTGISNQVLQSTGLQQAAKANDLNAYLDALEESLELIGLNEEAYDKLLNTSDVLWRKFRTNVSNNLIAVGKAFTNALIPGLQRLNEWLESDKATKFFAQLAAAFDLLGRIVTKVIDDFIIIIDVLVDNFDLFLTLGAIGLTLLAAKFVIAGAAAIAANWQILAIVAALLIIIKVAIDLGATFEEIFETIGTVAGVVITSVYNAFATVYNLIVGIVEGIIIAFDNIPAGIAIIMQSVVDTVLSAVQTIAGVLDHVFGSNLAAGVNKFRKDLYGEVRTLIPDGEDAPELERLKLLSLDEELSKWSDLFGRFGSKLDEFNETDWGEEFGNLLDGFEGFDQLGDIGNVGNVGTVGRLKDNTVKIQEEDIQKILDLIDRRNQRPIVNLQTMQPNIEVTVNNGPDGAGLTASDIAREIEQVIRDQAASETNLAYNY